MQKTLNLNGKLFQLNNPVVMGILNVTPDSFYDGGNYLSERDILRRAEEIITEGGAIIDIGGCSTRPGAGEVSAEEEMKRVLPAISSVIREFPEAVISVDSFRPDVVRSAIEEGASMVNDISGGGVEMYKTVASLKVPYILMHMKGNPRTMMKEAVYENLLEEMLDYFIGKINQLREAGVKDVIIDPGFGFAKTPDQNFVLMGKLKYFKTFNLPILVGISRKSMIYKKLGTTPDETLNGTTVLNTIALMNGASILRVHDVKECAEAVKLYKTIYP